jgi:hypothetical protein
MISVKSYSLFWADIQGLRTQIWELVKDEIVKNYTFDNVNYKIHDDVPYGAKLLSIEKLEYIFASKGYVAISDETSFMYYAVAGKADVYIIFKLRYQLENGNIENWVGLGYTKKDNDKDVNIRNI